MRQDDIAEKKFFMKEQFLGSPFYSQCAALSESQRGPCNLFSLLRSHIIIVVCIMFIIISIIVPGIYVMFMIIVYRLKPGSFCRLRAYGSLVFL